VNTLAVVGGTVLSGGGPVRSDVFIAEGRIVSVIPDVGTTGTGHAGAGGRSEGGTAGAGADRSTVGAPTRHDVDRAVGEASPAAGGGGSTAAGRVGRHAAVASTDRVDDTVTFDATGLVVAPGFIDLQINGAVGADLSSQPERIADIAAALPRWGVTAWLPTIVTGPADVRRRALATLARLVDVETARAADRAYAADAVDVADERDPGPAHAVPLGLHFEGPFLAPERRGAHDRTHLAAPSTAAVTDVLDGEGWSRDTGVALVTLAPELPGARDLVRALVERGVVVSLGHSSASAAEARAAADAGATYVTHLFNAMGPLHHREPGLAGVALTDGRLFAGVIVDGLHVDPAVVDLAVRSLGDRLSLVTDAVAALGAPAGRVPLGGASADVSPDDGAVRLADGTLAGSTLSLDQAVRNVVTFALRGLGGRTHGDAPGALTALAAAVRAVTATPAAVLGLPDRGVVAEGAVGDLVVLTPTGEVVATVIGGRVVHDARDTSVAAAIRRDAGPPWRS
jgi:N-acetylglucosamine-6-phosphate deacetylase